jgi:3-hydroxyisobutyrate dehydrogenase-like beta-hydroxyacid dehydrogenase
LEARGAPWAKAVRVNVGFIGIGAMGEPMSLSLRRAGFSVTASAHRNRERLERVLREGVTEAPNPAAVAEASDVVITCVPDAPQVEEALFGVNGAASGARSGTAFIDMSTISPVYSREFAERLQAGGCSFLDAPVSGGPARATTGTLTIMVGGSPEDFARVEPVLKAMGTPHHVGGVGLGETVKLVNQLIIANVMIANVEALTFAEKAGARLESVRGVLATATASNYLLNEWLPKTWFAGTCEGGFALDLLRKDLRAALDAAGAMKMPMPASGFAYQMYTLQSASGDGGLDYSAIAKFYEHVAGN